MGNENGSLCAGQRAENPNRTPLNLKASLCFLCLLMSPSQIMPRDAEGSDQTPLHIAVSEGHIAAALQLIDSASNRGDDSQAVCCSTHVLEMVLPC